MEDIYSGEAAQNDPDFWDEALTESEYFERMQRRNESDPRYIGLSVEL